MSRHLSPETVEMFAARQLAPKELVETARHITVCEECRAKVGEARRVHTRVQFIRDDLRREPLTHLSYEHLEGYVDKSLDAFERDLVTNHLACCKDCAAEARELAWLSDSLSTYPKAAKPEEPSPRLWHKLAGMLMLKPLRVAIAGVAVLALIASVFFFYQPQKTSEIAGNATPRQTPSPVPDDGNRAQPPVTEAAKEPPVAANIPPAYERIVKQALTNQRLSPSAASGLIGKTGKLMSSKNDSERFALQSPVGTVTETPRPVLHWQALKGARHYKVFILDEKFNLVTESPALAETSWQIPESLKRGNVYLWQVTANLGDREVTAPAAPLPEARFRVLGAAKASELEQIRRGNLTHLILGTIYAHDGLLDDAERELQIAARENQDAPLARKLLQSLKALRH